MKIFIYIISQFLRRLLLFLFSVSLDKYQEKYCKREEESAHFRETPFMGDYLSAAAWICTYMFYFVTVVVFAGIILMIVLCPLETKEDIAGTLGLTVLGFSMFLYAQFMKFLQLYFNNTETLYYEDYIIVKRYGRRDKIVTYEEIGQTVRAKGIRIRKGRLELPFKGGMTPIYVHEKDRSFIMKRLFWFLNKKCDITLPELTIKEQKKIRRTGLLPVCMYTVAAIWTFDLCLQIFSFIYDAGKNTFWALYFPGSLPEFCKSHIFIVFAMPFALLGILVELLNWIPFRICLSKYKIFRVW